MNPETGKKPILYLPFPDLLDAVDDADDADSDDDGPEVDLLQLAVRRHPPDGLHHATGLN